MPLYFIHWCMYTFAYTYAYILAIHHRPSSSSIHPRFFPFSGEGRDMNHQQDLRNSKSSLTHLISGQPDGCGEYQSFVEVMQNLWELYLLELWQAYAERCRAVVNPKTSLWLCRTLESCNKRAFEGLNKAWERYSERQIFFNIKKKICKAAVNVRSSAMSCRMLSTYSERQSFEEVMQNVGDLHWILSFDIIIQNTAELEWSPSSVEVMQNAVELQWTSQPL